MPPTEPNDAVNPKDNPDLGAVGVEEPPPMTSELPDEDLWDRYNKRMEFPLATVAAVFLHVVVGATLIYVLVGLMTPPENPDPPIKMVAVNGMDDSGEGSPGAGTQDADLNRNTDPFSTPDVTAPETPADPKENNPSTALAPGAIPLPKKSSLGGGKSNDGPPGSGVGGTGSDSTRARGLRWVLRFRVASGKDYIEQLKAMGASIAVPLPPDDNNFLFFEDLGNPQQRAVSKGDLNKFVSGRLQFSDSRQSQVREVCAVLGVNAPSLPKYFSAYFPKSMEEELARKEKSYRNRHSDDIEETIFIVTVRGGTYELVVFEQKVKK